MEKSIYSQDYAVFLRLLKEAREQAGTTQEQLAARLGQTQSFISKCERGERRLDVVEAGTFCMALGISLSDLGFSASPERFPAAFGLLASIQPWHGRTTSTETALLGFR